MTGALAPRLVLVTRETEYDGLMARHATRGQAAAFLPFEGMQAGLPVEEVGGVEGLAQGGDLDIRGQGLAFAHGPVHQHLVAAADGQALGQVVGADAELADMQVQLGR